MKTRHLMTWGILILGSSLLRAADVDFNRDIRPILATQCFACHGPDREARKADLRLDTEQGAKASAIVPGDLEASELIARIGATDPDRVMPPPDSGHVLTEKQKTRLSQWVASGAPFDTHWSFVAPHKSPLPKISQGDWPRHALDHFVLAALEDAGLRPTSEADPYRLIRRVALDLTGLPPTVAQADAFAKHPTDSALEAFVDEQLKSPAFGEHWARMWLDMARYADTKGYEKDRHRTIWRYRDWVIDALNRDLPYDQFTIEQLAGDLLPEPSTDQLIATAFHRNTMENEEGGTDNEEFRVAAVKDRVDTTLQVWMGLTMGCAKCHSHKYDPISQRDYYAFFALFNQTQDADREPPTIPSPTQHQKQQIGDLEKELQSLKHQLASGGEEFDKALKAWTTQFDDKPIWTPLRIERLDSKTDVSLSQDQQGTLSVHGELPEKDTWKLQFKLPAGETITAFRIDTLPKPPGGKWSDKNVALRELSAELIGPGDEAKRLRLVRPRADFSQRGWEVARAIDGNKNAGWAFSPKAAEPHAAVFDFEKPIKVAEGQMLRLTMEQEYGQGLTFKDFRISWSSYPAAWLTPDVDAVANLPLTFRGQVYEPTKQLAAQIESKQKSLADLRKGVPTTPIIRELAPNKRRETRIHKRGNFLDQGQVVEPAVPVVFGKLPDQSPNSRLGVAHWLIQADNPLTARVAVNRIWARLFGTGIVETEEDFGTQGSYPSNQLLLDWLAVDFREGGWSLKELLKTIVMSSTYRQSASVSKERLEMDPQNRLMSRGPRFRLSAETVRDQALAVSGLLHQQIGGPSAMPPQPPGIWKSTYNGEKWKNATGPDRYRRALYTYLKRTSPYPSMTTFDSGSGEVCQIRRVRTNTPLQSLVTLNDTAFFEAAGALAAGMQKSSDSLPQQIGSGFRRVLIRPPEPVELQRLVDLYEELDEELSKDELLKAAGISQGDPRLVVIANVLLNLDETLMKP